MEQLAGYSLNYALPAALEAAAPPEARGLPRDHVRLMVTSYASGAIRHTRFDRLPDILRPGDVLVLNASGTRNAALRAFRADGSEVELHLSTQMDNGLWTVEPRSIHADGKTQHLEGVMPGEKLLLPAGVSAVLHQPYVSDCELEPRPSKTLWEATIGLPSDVDAYLRRWGFPIRYNYVKDRWPASYYQNVYATEPGSAEMPSAGRPLTRRVLKRLSAKGVQVVSLMLHTGVSNVEAHEPPYKESYRVPSEMARLVSEAHRDGRRVIAVGTTVVRALESVVDAQGNMHAGEGWTCLVVTPQRPLRVIDGLLTGFHEPEASHLAILEALAGKPHVEAAYREALAQGYLWHEFGDVHLILR